MVMYLSLQASILYIGVVEMEKSRTCLNNKKGFTLVELMIVVVIMAILVAVAIPVYKVVTSNVKKNTCDNNRRALSGTITNYINGVYSEDGEKRKVPNFEVHSENNAPVFYEIGTITAGENLADFSVWLMSQYQDEKSIYCNAGGIITVEIIKSGEMAYAQVVCSLHGGAD